jgi:hypothetical protein
VPAAVTAASAGLGYGLALASGLRLRWLTVPAGFLAGITLATVLWHVGIAGAPLAVILVAAGLAGPAYGWVSGRRPALRGEGARDLIWGAAAGLGGYAVAMAPIVGSGRSVVLGYVFNDDSAIHVALSEAIADGATGAFDVQADSYGYGTAIFDTGYPLGSYMWPAFGRLIGGEDPFQLWSPLSALVLGLLALVAYEMLRSLKAPPLYAAVAAVIVPAGNLVYAYHTQGGMKEVIMPVAVLATAALCARALDAGASPRTLLPAGFAGAAAIANLGFAAVAWLAPLALATVVVIVWRFIRGVRVANARRLLLFGAALLAVAVPVAISSRRYVTGYESDLSDPAEIGNLFDAISPWQMLNIWLTGDYRFKPTDYPTFTYTALTIAGLLALGGLARAFRTRDLSLPLAVGASIVGALLITPRTSIYYDAKTYVVIAPALGIATAAGVLALWSRQRALRVLAVAAAGTVAVGVVWSAVLIYAHVWVTPKERFGELATVAERFHDVPNILVADREQYAFYFLRDLGPWDDWGYRQPRRGLRLPDNRPPPPPRAPDLDDYQLAHLSRFGHLLERRSPGGSRAPANYRPVFETEHYRVWERTGPPPRAHLALGRETPNGVQATERLACRSDRPRNRQVLALARRAGRLGAPLVASIDTAPPVIAIPAIGWAIGDAKRAVPAPGTAAGRAGGGLAKGLGSLRGSYVAWVHGSFGPGLRLWSGTRTARRNHIVGDVFNDLGPPGWQPIGTVELGPGTVLEAGIIDRPKLLAGSRHFEIVAALKLVPVNAEKRLETVPAADVSTLCGRNVDWVEIPAP